MTRTTLTLIATLVLGVSALAQVSFAPGVSLPVGTQPDDAVVADFDGNGILDLAVSVDLPDRVVFFFGNGLGGFPTSSTVFMPGGSSPAALAAADFDGNGTIDCAVSLKNVNSVQLLVNSGAGVFTPGSSAATGQEPRYMTAADLDGNGFADLVTANRDSDDISVILNSAGTLAAGVNIPSGMRPQGIDSGDLNGDGIPDVVASNHDSRTLSVFTGNGLGGLNLTATLSVGGLVRPENVRIADINGDFLPDVATATNGTGFNTVTYFINSFGTFGGAVTAAVGGVEPGDVEVVDFDGDGLNDFATANKLSANASVMKNLGGGLFGAPLLLGAGTTPERVTSGDLDGDGDRDLLVVNRDSNDVTIFINTSMTGGGPMATYPGSGEDLITQTAVGLTAIPTGGATNDVKSAVAGDLLTLRFASPGGTFNLLPPLVVAQLFATGSPPMAPSTFPYLHIDIFATPGPFAIINGAVPNPLNVSEVILPGGNVHGWVILPGFAGLSVILQPVVGTSLAANGIFAAADAHEIILN